MSENPRKKSPRAPSIALDEAIEKAIKVYDKERRHSAPVEVVAQDLGYKSANNGAALSAIASLRYYGLLERPKEGVLAVSKDVEAYQFAPSEDVRRDLLARWLKTPAIFSELLEKYEGGLPSDATLRFDLIQREFSQATAELVISVFKRSVQFARYFESRMAEQSAPPQELAEESNSEQRSETFAPNTPPELTSEDRIVGVDRIPVRLPQGRRAWLLIPTPFFESDKKRLKDQIDLLFAEKGGDQASA
jgi:hypothetical protein